MKNEAKQIKLLVVGGGGREAAIIWKLSQSAHPLKLYCCPGNFGTAALAQNVPLAATDLEGIVAFAQQEELDMVMVAPDDPLALGLVDRLTACGIKAFGPTAAAARIEASKIFSKQLMQAHGIPTAAAAVFDDEVAALAWLDAEPDLPRVVKADGLALGKGVVVCDTREEAKEAVRLMMSGNAFGKAGSRVLLEERLTGPELTVLAFCDGKTIRPMPPSRDHKRAFDGDEGPNTGGMGAIVPGADLSPADLRRMDEEIFQPTVKALAEAGAPFKGVIYFGLMLTADGPKVIEYNARFGDPECQAILPLLETDLYEIFCAVIDERLDEIDIRWKDKASCALVAASGGYPGSYPKGLPITGLDDRPALIFHAGTAASPDGQGAVTAGGRVLCVVGVEDTLEEAIDAAYKGMEPIHFEGMFFRHDIGRTVSPS